MLSKLWPAAALAASLACNTPQAAPSRPIPDPASTAAPEAPWSSDWARIPVPTALPSPSTEAPVPEVTPSEAEPAHLKAVYACPMHPDFTSDHPGTCPKCGMALVKKKGGKP